MNISSSSFTKDIFTRLKQINNDVKLLKNSQSELVNSRIDGIETRLTRLETIIENKFDLLFDKLNNNNTNEKDTVNIDLLSKLDNIDNIISSDILIQPSNTQITDINNNYLKETDNIDVIKQIDNVDEIDITTYLGNNKLNNDIKTVENSINMVDEILILD